ncbi:MAG TPA: HAMP domain-containing histidine kinase, partial [Sulfurovum sp.]|nr:HAMP domain-containing histidine kinase [Sulfurovum sp.]
MYRKILNILFPNKFISNQNNFKKNNKARLKEEKNLIHQLKENTKPIEPVIGIFRIQNLLNEVYGLIEPYVQEKNIEFLYDIHESVPIEIVGNILALEQILYNLLSTILENQLNSTIVVTLKKVNENLVIEIIGKHLINQQAINEHSINIETSKQLITDMLGTFTIAIGQSNTIYKVTIPFLRHALYQESY